MSYVCLTVASLILKATPNPLLLLPMATAWSTSISWAVNSRWAMRLASFAPTAGGSRSHSRPLHECTQLGHSHIPEEVTLRTRSQGTNNDFPS